MKGTILRFLLFHSRNFDGLFLDAAARVDLVGRAGNGSGMYVIVEEVLCLRKQHFVAREAPRVMGVKPLVGFWWVLVGFLICSKSHDCLYRR